MHSDTDVIASTPDFTVTRSSVTILDKTYFVNNISSIEIIKLPESEKRGQVVKAGMEKRVNVGCGTAILGLALIFISGLMYDANIILMILGGAIIFVGLGLAMNSMEDTITKEARVKHTVIFDTNSGKIQAYTTYSSELAETLKRAIERAVKSR